MKKLGLYRFLCFILLGLLLVPTAFAQTHLVISQIYGGGGNSGAVYTNDFIELYNPTSSPISLNGWSIQYTSTAGVNNWIVVSLPNTSVAAGHYFLIQAAAGANTFAPLPTPDLISATPAIAATGGKIALVSSTTALSGSAAGTGTLGGTACPTNTSALVDFLGWGSATCYEGTAPAAVTANATSSSRRDPAVDTDSNSADFATGAPNPHNSTYGNPVTITAVGSATPSTVTSGDTVTLLVAVTPAPTSTGIQVTANLAAIGGAVSQAFYDDGTNGDAVAGDNVFSFTTTATTSTNGAVSLPVSVTDAQSNTATASISLTVNQPVYTVAIHEIQGSKSLSATSISPYAGKWVKTHGIVTAVGSVGFFIQSKDAEADADPTTPEGIYVYAGSGKVPASAVIGNELEVTGLVATYPLPTASHTPASEITSPTFNQLSTGNPLPAAVVIDASKLTPGGGLYQLTPYEGMRVSIPSLTVVAPTDGSLTESTETQKSNGRFFAVVTGTPRPFREPGIDVRDTPPAGAPANIAQFDDNPERIIVDSTFLSGGTVIDVSTGAVLANVTGILDMTFSSDSYYDPSRLLLDAAYDRNSVVAGMSVQAVALPRDDQFTVAAFNVERFFNPDSTDDVYMNPVSGSTGKSSAVDITADAYARRLQKVSLAIRNVLNFPDIVSLEEVENKGVADAIAAQISADAQTAGQTDPLYVAYGTGTEYAPYTNDIGGISIGFLVKSSRFNNITVTQYGADTLMTDPRNGTTQQTLNDRPPLVLRAGLKRTDALDYPVTVISNHLRSLSGINDSSSGVFVRAKKEAQAEYLANLIQQFQAAGEHVISVGDYNVFEFSDGFTDVMATVTGQAPLPSDQVVTSAAPNLVTPPATDLVTLLPADQRYSYSEVGNAQVLDHVVATSDLVAAGAYVTYAHSNADFPVIMYNDATSPARVSDHDPAVGYFAIPDPVLTATLTPATADFGTLLLNQSSTGQQFVLTNTGEGLLTLNSITVGTDYAETDACSHTLPVGYSCSINVVFTPTTAGPHNSTLAVNLSSGTYSSTLTGTGRDPLLSATLTPSTAAFGSLVVDHSSTAQPFTVTNTGEAALTVTSIAVGTDYSQTNDCGSTIAIGASCTVNVVFKPTAGGSRNGTLTVILNAGTYTSSLTGTGIAPDFAVAGTSGTSLIVPMGSSGSLSLKFTPANGFNGTVTLTCNPSGSAPTGVTCAVPAPFTMNGTTAVTQNVTFQTTPLYTASGRTPTSRLPWQGTLAIAIVGIVIGSRSRRVRMQLLVIVMLATAFFAVGCGSSNAPKRNPNGTQTGTYTYTVTATSGTVSHSQTVTLVVQ